MNAIMEVHPHTHNRIPQDSTRTTVTALCALFICFYSQQQWLLGFTLWVWECCVDFCWAPKLERNRNAGSLEPWNLLYLLLGCKAGLVWVFTRQEGLHPSGKSGKISGPPAPPSQIISNQTGVSTHIFEWKCQDPKMEVLYHIKQYSFYHLT
jgi:hypothetical protein